MVSNTGKISAPLRSKTIFHPGPHIYSYTKTNVGLPLFHILIEKLNLNKMKQIKTLTAMSETLVLLLEDLTNLLNDIDNCDLVMEIENNVVSPMENAQAQLDIILDDIDDGVYDENPGEDDFEEWE
jgi:hypothetical protein